MKVAVIMAELTNFVGNDTVGAIEALLERVGEKRDLGSLVSDHLCDVLRRQAADVVIEAVDFIGAGACRANGERINGSIAALHSISVPVQLHVSVASGSRTYELGITLTINAVRVDGAFTLTTDMIVDRQHVGREG